MTTVTAKKWAASPSSYSAKVETVTPQMAKDWLAKNTNNRSMSQRTVEYYQDMITRNVWQVNGESIKIAEDGTLLDGQHRLQAIANSGVSIDTFVVRGLSTESFKTIDAGKSRSNADYLKINGSKCTQTHVLAAAARVAMAFDKVTGEYVYTSSKTSPSQIIWYVENNPGLENSVITQLKNVERKIVSTSVAAGCHYIFSVLDPESADDFFHALSTGANLDDGSPILALRNRLISMAGSGRAGGTHQKMIVSYFVTAFNAYRAGRKLASVSYSPDRLIVLNDFAGSML